MSGRLKGADRRRLILAAATAMFAQHGDQARTQQIASAAGVSEALVFQHFGNKRGLYKAVLCGLILEQNAWFQALGPTAPDADGLVAILRRYFRACLEPSPNAANIRILFLSLSADGDYARLTYRRAARLSHKPLERAMAAARRAGDIAGTPIAGANIIAFVEHIGSMFTLTRSGERPIFPEVGDDAARVRQAVWYAGRGLGLTEAALERGYRRGEAPLRTPELAGGADGP
jgi:AcrR family transcriptional regulator